MFTGTGLSGAAWHHRRLLGKCCQDFPTQSVKISLQTEQQNRDRMEDSDVIHRQYFPIARTHHL